LVHSIAWNSGGHPTRGGTLTFANLHLLKDPAKRESIRNDLLAYCRLDTLAMVKILEKLRGIVLDS
jgi:hypothetical protein